MPGKYSLLPELSPQSELALLCRTLQREGYDDHIAGHISYLQDDGSLLINPRELSWGEVTAGDIIRIDQQGNVVEGAWNVTPAIPLHLAIHQHRKDIRVIVHNHSLYGTLWANVHKTPPLYDQTSAQSDMRLGVLEHYGGPVSLQEESELTALALENKDALLLANHGVLITAPDIRRAHLRAVTLEWRCRQAWKLRGMDDAIELNEEISKQIGATIEKNGFPFLWEAMARREIKTDPKVLEE